MCLCHLMLWCYSYSKSRLYLHKYMQCYMCSSISSKPLNLLMRLPSNYSSVYRLTLIRYKSMHLYLPTNCKYNLPSFNEI